MKATRTTIKYGSIDLEVFMLPDGSYSLSQTQVGFAIEKHDKSLRQFLDGSSPEALPHKDFSRRQEDIEIEGLSGAASSFKAVPLRIAIAYWTYWANKGNVLAQALLAAGTEETLTRLCDNAFGVAKTEQQYNSELAANIENSKMMLEMMSLLTQMNERLEQQERRFTAVEQEKEELEQFKEEVNEFDHFIELLEITRTEVSDADYPNGVAVYDFLVDWDRRRGEKVDPTYWATVSRRASQYYRILEGKDPDKRGSRSIFKGRKVAYIIATMRLIQLGI